MWPALLQSVLLVATAMPLAARSAPPIGDPLPVREAIGRYEAERQTGGPGPDGIPAIDQPRFTNAKQARLEDGDPVVGLWRNGEAKAYPQSILVWHEIVNDEIDGENVAVTYCPLTGTSVGFLRKDSEFGVTGDLVNSNLIFYDRDTRSEFPQMLATAISGPLRRKSLVETRLIWTTWDQWRTRYPETLVLSEDTGYMRNYARDPYGSYNPRSGYYSPDSGPIFPVMHSDSTYPAKQIVLGIRDHHGAFSVNMETLRERGILTTQLGEVYYAVIYDAGLETGWVYRSDAPLSLAASDVSFDRDGADWPGRPQAQAVNAFKAMWFAWTAFYPDAKHLE